MEAPRARPNPEDDAFFDGYIWGRLQERHDEKQNNLHDDDHHDAFVDDDSFDDDGD